MWPQQELFLTRYLSAPCLLFDESLFASPTGIISSSKSIQFPAGRHSLKRVIALCWRPAQGDTLHDHSEEIVLPFSKKTADAFLMISVNSRWNFPYRACCFVQNQNCTSTEQRFQRLSKNVKKKVSGREVNCTLLTFVNTICAAINCPSVVLELW